MKRTKIAISVFTVVVLAAIGVVFLFGGDDEPDKTSASASTRRTTTTTEPEESNDSEDDGLTDDEIDRLVDKAFTRMGFAPDEVVTGDDVEFDGVAEERGEASFSKVTLKTQQDVSEFLHGDSPQSIAARERVQEALKDMPGEFERAMSGEGYVPIQFKVAVQYFGTTYFNGSDVIVAGDPRQTEPDDILWLFVSKDGVIVAQASIRADCGNPDFKKIVPVRPETPPAPPISEPPCLVNCKPPPPPPELEPKDPSKSTNNNEEIPQVRKTRPSTDNQEQVDEGPVAPVDSPTGCVVNCHEDPTFKDPPPTTTTTRPPSSSTTTVPSCGQAGQPSCDNTGVNPPPTTQPPAPPPQEEPNTGTVVSP